MKINIYYGGRGIIDDPSLFVLERMTTVLKELNVKTEQFNLFEQRGGILSLPATLKGCDGIILATTVEWYGIGGYMQQFLDACWLYGDKNLIAKLYMMPVVMSTTTGERRGMMDLSVAWEILGGKPCEGVCGYVADNSILENNNAYMKLIEKRAENLYRTVNQKLPVLPSSNRAVSQRVSLTKSADLTPQESEQLSQYAADDKYVEKQKQDIRELADLFRSKMEKPDSKTTGGSYTGESYIERFKNHFHPQPDIHALYSIFVTDAKEQKYLRLKVDGKTCDAAETKEEVKQADVAITLTKDILDEILDGHVTFQRAFMGGNMKMKGDFRLLRNMDQLFAFMES